MGDDIYWVELEHAVGETRPAPVRSRWGDGRCQPRPAARSGLTAGSTAPLRRKSGDQLEVTRAPPVERRFFLPEPLRAAARIGPSEKKPFRPPFCYKYPLRSQRARGVCVCVCVCVCVQFNLSLNLS